MTEIVVDTSKVLALLGLLFFLFIRRRDLRRLPGRSGPLILAGFGLLLFGCLLDLAGSLEVPGFSLADGLPLIVLREVVGFLGGAGLLAVGFYHALAGRRADANDGKVNVAAADALHGNAGDLQRAERIAMVGRWRWDVVGDRLISCSEEYARIHGVDLDEARDLMNERMERVIHPDDRARVQAAFERVGEKSLDHEIEYRIVRPDGEVRHLLEVGETLLDGSGKARERMGAVLDITERKQAEEKLRKAQQELEPCAAERTAEIEAANEALRQEIREREKQEEAARARQSHLNQAQALAKIGVFIWDNVTDKATYYSDGLALLLAMSEEQMRTWGDSHENTLEQVVPEDRAHYHRVIRDAESAVSAYDVEYRIRDAAGNLRHWREIGEPIKDEQGRLVRTFGTIQDTTDMKLAEEQLRQAQKMEAIGQLTGGVAHDFNNLLAVILGNAELLNRLSHHKFKELVEPIVVAGRRGAELTQRLLSYSRQQALRPRPIDLAGVVTGQAELLKRALGEEVEIETFTDPDLWTASADPNQVENAMLNLAINARDAMPNGGKLTIRCVNVRLEETEIAPKLEASPGDFVVLDVTDNGTGMAPNVRQRAFEPFFTTKEVGKGSGLGLSMVYGFAKQSGGHVDIYSEEGWGTTVKLYLPRSEAGKAAAGEVKIEEQVPRGFGEMVLVIEDDAEVRRSAVMMLASLGYQTTDVPEASKARAALARGHKFDLILSDVVLPGGVSGPEFAAELKDRFPDLSTVFMSGYPAEAARPRDMRISDEILLNKPFELAELAKALRSALD